MKPSGVILSTKQAHKASITSTVCFKTKEGKKLPDLLLSASEDSTIKLWDFRVNKAVKLFRNKEFDSENHSNIQLSQENDKIHIASANKVG